MSDATDIIGNSLIQHGPSDDLVYLMRLDPADTAKIIENLEQLAASSGYSKVCAKVPASEARLFVSAGYQLEAAIPCSFQQKDSACFMAKFLSSERKQEQQPLLVREVLVTAEAQERAGTVHLPAGFSFRQAVETEAQEIAAFYREVLAAKPMDVHDPAFILEEMQRGSIVFGIWKEQNLAAVSFALLDPPAGSAEMAHVAVRQKHLTDGLELGLLQQMEEMVRRLGFRSVFGMARAYSFGINITFARNGYRYGGTLTNNSNVFGRLESVNVWHKSLNEDPVHGWKSVFEPKKISGQNSSEFAKGAKAIRPSADADDPEG